MIKYAQCQCKELCVVDCLLEIAFSLSPHHKIMNVSFCTCTIISQFYLFLLQPCFILVLLPQRVSQCETQIKKRGKNTDPQIFCRLGHLQLLLGDYSKGKTSHWLCCSYHSPSLYYWQHSNRRLFCHFASVKLRGEGMNLRSIRRHHSWGRLNLLQPFHDCLCHLAHCLRTQST